MSKVMKHQAVIGVGVHWDVVLFRVFADDATLL
jgi:hypothetical protein